MPLDLDVSCLYKPSKAFEQFVTLEKLEKSKREHTLLEMLKTLCFLKVRFFLMSCQFLDDNPKLDRD